MLAEQRTIIGTDDGICRFCWSATPQRHSSSVLVNDYETATKSSRHEAAIQLRFSYVCSRRLQKRGCKPSQPSGIRLTKHDESKEGKLNNW